MKLVVWFPGLGSFANVTGNILEYFEKDTDTDVLCVSYDTFGLSGYRRAAARLSGPLETILEAYDEVIYIGHSMGGHVAAELVLNHGHDITKLIAVSSPPAAYWALPLMPGFVQPGLIKDFGGHPNWPTNIPVLKIYGQLDILANPASPLLTSYDSFQDNVSVEKIPFHTHMSILYSPRAAGEIYGFATYA